MPYGTTARFVHQEVQAVPAGFKVRTVKAGKHQVRVAFPPGPRRKGSGIVVGVLHPRGENPCPVAQKNPAELLLMGGNPLRQAAGGRSRGSLYDQFSRKDRLILGRAGIGKKDITTEADVREARRIIEELGRMKNRLPNPGTSLPEERPLPGASSSSGRLPSVDSANAAAGRNLYEKFHARESERYIVRDEPHMPAGDYTELGKLIALRVKPTPTGQTTHVQEISFPHKHIRVVCDPDGRQIWFVGDGQQQTEDDLRIFSDGATHARAMCWDLGLCRSIVYEATKWHPQLAESARGERIEWEHEFGEEGGTCPTLSYDTHTERLLLGKASYHVEGAGIVN